MYLVTNDEDGLDDDVDDDGGLLHGATLSAIAGDRVIGTAAHVGSLNVMRLSVVML